MEEEETFKVKLIFNEEQIEVSLNSQYDYFFNTIYNIFKISINQLENIILSYKDSDGDDVILSSEEDYKIFFEQVSQNQVDNFKITIKEDGDLDQNELLINLLNYQEEQGLRNNINRNNIDNNYDEIEERNNNYEENNNNENNINDDMNNNNKVNEDIPIDDLIFDYQCSSCGIKPIICKLLYCSKCSFYLCQECEKKGIKHKHELLKIESREVLRTVQEEENIQIEKKHEEERQIKEKSQQNQRNNKNFDYNNYQNNPQINQSSHLGYKNDGNRRIYYINNDPNNPNIPNYTNKPYYPNCQNIQYNPNIPHHQNIDNNLHFNYNCQNDPHYQQFCNDYNAYQDYYNNYH